MVDHPEVYGHVSLRELLMVPGLVGPHMGACRVWIPQQRPWTLATKVWLVHEPDSADHAERARQLTELDVARAARGALALSGEEVWKVIEALAALDPQRAGWRRPIRARPSQRLQLRLRALEHYAEHGAFLPASEMPGPPAQMTRS